MRPLTGEPPLTCGRKLQAVKHLERVLEISREIRDFVGDADAYGTIAGEPRLGHGGRAQLAELLGSGLPAVLQAHQAPPAHPHTHARHLHRYDGV